VEEDGGIDDERIPKKLIFLFCCPRRHLTRDLAVQLALSLSFITPNKLIQIVFVLRLKQTDCQCYGAVFEWNRWF
jgi:hypothetical protein